MLIKEWTVHNLFKGDLARPELPNQYTEYSNGVILYLSVPTANYPTALPIVHLQ